MTGVTSRVEERKSAENVRERITLFFGSTIQRFNCSKIWLRWVYQWLNSSFWVKQTLWLSARLASASAGATFANNDRAAGRTRTIFRHRSGLRGPLLPDAIDADAPRSIQTRSSIPR